MKISRSILCQTAIVLLLGACSAFAQNPTLFFTDIESGPKTGGQSNQGAFITIYGNFFGASQGTSTVTIGGGIVDHCPIWGATWLWYQKITCQLGSRVATGNIVVTVNGQESNGLPFTVRSGNIYFVNNGGGDDGNDGSFASPWRSVLHAKNTVSDGDTVYLRAGTWNVDIDQSDGASALYMSGQGGSSGLPRAFIGYPGETATIACTPASSQCYDIRSVTGPAGWLVFAELDLGANSGTHYIIDWEGGGGGDGIRWIGNKIHGAYSVNVVLQGSMNPSNFLGNDDYDYWSLANGASINERGYGLYYGGYGTQQNIQIEWNRFYNDQGTSGVSTKGLQIYGHIKGDNFVDVTVANNQSVDNCMQGMAIGGSDDQTVPPWRNSGTLYVYNNLIAGNGACDTINDLTYSGLQIGDGLGAGMDARIWNNTFWLNAGGTIGGQGAGDIYIFPDSESFDISNNIFFAQPSESTTYSNFIYVDGSLSTSTLSGTNNLFFSNGNSNAVAPAWVSGTVSTGDPKFVNPSTDPSTADFHLRADSPARNAGAALGLVSRDLEGIARPQEKVYDVGAYEYGSADNPPVFEGEIVNGATFTADSGTSPGAIMSLFGQSLASGTNSADGFPMPLTLLDTQVLVNGTAAPLFFVSPQQINFQMPFEGWQATMDVTVVVNGVASPGIPTALAAQAPAIFSDGSGYGAVQNDDGTPNSASNPAVAGSEISFYLTGMGGLSPALRSGQPAGSGNLTLPPTAVLIGGSAAPQVLFSGAAPGFVGLDQINVRLPAGITPGSAVTLQVQAGGKSSNIVTFAVR